MNESCQFELVIVQPLRFSTLWKIQRMTQMATSCSTNATV